MGSEKGYILHSLLTLGFCDSDSIIFTQIRTYANYILDLILAGYYYNNHFKIYINNV